MDFSKKKLFQADHQEQRTMINDLNAPTATLQLLAAASGASKSLTATSWAWQRFKVDIQLEGPGNLTWQWKNPGILYVDIFHVRLPERVTV